MTNDGLIRTLRRAALALGLGLAASAASAEELPPAPPPSGVAYPPPTAAAETAPAPRAATPRLRSEIHPYLEVSQVVSAELDSGDTLTYTSLAAGVDGNIRTRRVTVSIGYRYQR